MPDPFIAFQGGDPSDTRFQFEVIKGLAESIRQLTGSIQDMQKTQVSMLERLAVLEAGKMTHRIDDIDIRIDALFKDKDRRDGALGMLGVIKSWAPFIGMILTAAIAFVVYGRMAGVVPPPPAAPARLEATGNTENHRIEGVVGGKP